MGFLGEDTFYSTDIRPYDGAVTVPAESVWGELQIPRWWSEALERLAFLCNPSDNWDSYGAKAVNRNIAYCAVQILQAIARPGIPAPSIVPTKKGNLQFEWHEQGIDLEFEVLSPVKISASYEDAVTGTEWDKDLDYNLTPLSDTLRLLLIRIRENAARA